MQESQRGRVRTFQNPQSLPLQARLDEMPQADNHETCHTSRCRKIEANAAAVPIRQKLPDMATNLCHPHCMAHSGAEEINLGSNMKQRVGYEKRRNSRKMRSHKRGVHVDVWGTRILNPQWP